MSTKIGNTEGGMLISESVSKRLEELLKKPIPLSSVWSTGTSTTSTTTWGSYTSSSWGMWTSTGTWSGFTDEEQEIIDTIVADALVEQLVAGMLTPRTTKVYWPHMPKASPTIGKISTSSVTSSGDLTFTYTINDTT